MAMGWKEDIAIDQDRLDWELMRQPLLMVEYTELLADAQDVRDRKKEKLDLTRSKIDYRIRSDPEGETGLTKPTEAAISNTILADNEYRKVNDEYMKAVHHVRVLEGARNAVDQRKSVLVKLADLWIAGYWAEPRIKKEAKEGLESKSTEGVRQGLERSGSRMMKRKNKEEGA